MQRACQLALQGEGHVEPNPMVGCVLVRNDELLAEGFHERFGGPHAERVALSKLAVGAARGATAYVSLEPCCHHGKTPPCTDALIDAGIARVCFATLDPFPKVSGQGAERLRAAGIHVDVGCLESVAREVLAPFLKRTDSGLPFVIAKWAMSLDGKMATRTGDSKWISSDASRQHAHRIRGRMDAIIVGSRTAIVDDPMLTARPAGPRVPLRVVVDSNATLPLESRLVQTARDVPVLLWTGTSAPVEKTDALASKGVIIARPPANDDRLGGLLRYLANEHAATNVLVEGGGKLLGALADQNLIDEYHVYIAPKIIGGQSATIPFSANGQALVADGPQLKVLKREQLGDDSFISARCVSLTSNHPAH